MTRESWNLRQVAWLLGAAGIVVLTFGAGSTMANDTASIQRNADRFQGALQQLRTIATMQIETEADLRRALEIAAAQDEALRAGAVDHLLNAALKNAEFASSKGERAAGAEQAVRQQISANADALRQIAIKLDQSARKLGKAQKIELPAERPLPPVRQPSTEGVKALIQEARAALAGKRSSLPPGMLHSLLQAAADAVTSVTGVPVHAQGGTFYKCADRAYNNRQQCFRNRPYILHATCWAAYYIEMSQCWLLMN